MPVSAVNAAVRRLLEESFGALWVTGEIGSWRRHHSGHCYFSLKDSEAQLSCVMFRSDARRLPTEPADGMEVCALGRLTVYEAGGKYQLVVRELEARGEGLWRLAFDRLRAVLAAEGLLDPERKRPLPPVPMRVGVVTSRSGAALRDVVSVIRRRAPWTRVVLSACSVQGREAAPEIAAALTELGTSGSCEVIVLTRGGGSVEDLWAFNEESVARAIAACPVPVVSAVGHEIDYTIADLVADARAPTPSAAAETVVPEEVVLRGRLDRMAGELAGALRGLVERGKRRTDDAQVRLSAAIRQILADRAARVRVAAGRLDALSPLATLGRGYALAIADDGTVLRRGDMFSVDQGFALRVVDARVGCRVVEVVDLPTPDEGT